MATPHPVTAQTLDEFLAWEETQTERHVFFGGEVFAMAGARQAHVLVTGNVLSALKQALRGGPCRTFVSDMKLRVAAAEASFYPDVLVTCDSRDRATPTFVSHPRLIVEVVSDATESFDRGGKFAACRTIETLSEYVLIDIPARRTEVFRRGADGLWVLHEFVGEQVVTLASVDVTLSADVLFEDVDDGAPTHGLPLTAPPRPAPAA
jgi:Uma2 family endonuclease